MNVAFTTTLSRLNDGMRHHILTVPPEVAKTFEEASIKRVLLELNGKQYRRAIQRKKDGRRIIVLGQDILKEVGIQLGDQVEVSLQPDADPNYVETGEELAEVLAQDDEARARWETFSVGKRRSLALYVTTAKRVDTRIKRAMELAEKIRTHTLHGDID